jgi:uncharacterized delta-60 repeat protein
MRKGAILVIIAVVAAMVAVYACGGRPVGLVNQPQGLVNLQAADSGQSVSDALSELDALECPEGVDAGLWAELKGALEEALECRAATCGPPLTQTAEGQDGGARVPALQKTASTPPTGEANRVNDLAIADNGDGTFTLSWHYRNLGDYDQNGKVAIADITPLAQHFCETYDPETEPNSIQAVIDGSGNGKIGIEDVTPIAQCFNVDCAGYRIEGADSEDGPFSLLQEVAQNAGTGEGRRSFSVQQALTAGDWVRLVPEDALGGEGIPVSPVQVVAANLPPVAALTADPVEGLEPLTVEFDASGSSDPDGNIVKYEWDWNGQGVWVIDSGSNPSVQHTYTTPGTYDAAVRVTDDDGDRDTASVEIKVLERSGIEWIHTWGGSADDEAFAVTADAAGNVYVAGGTWSFGMSNGNSLIVKYTATGEREWHKTWGGPGGFDFANALAVGGNGNIYVVGRTMSFAIGGVDSFLLRYSPEGELDWRKVWGGADSESASAVGFDESDNVYVVGNTSSFGSGGQDIFILKYAPAGTLLWQKTWGGTGNETASSIVVGADSLFVGGVQSQNALLVKFSLEGELSWARTWGGDYYDGSSALAKDNDGNIILAGSTGSFSTGDYDFFVLKYNADGGLLWGSTTGGNSHDIVQGVAVDGSCNVYVVGNTNSFGAGDYGSILLVMYSPAGELMWRRTWGEGERSEGADSLTFSPDGKLYLAGSAPDVHSSWEDQLQSTIVPAGTVNSLVYESADVIGTEGNPIGTEKTPVGVDDEGGGSTDILLMKLALWHWE